MDAAFGVVDRAFPLLGVPGLSDYTNKKNTISFNRIADLHKFWIKNEFITSFVFKLGVDRDDDEPERDGGLSVDDFELLLPGLSFPFNPILSRESTWSPFGRGDGDSYSNKKTGNNEIFYGNSYISAF